jgi:uncharacterized membrane protein
MDKTRLEAFSDGVIAIIITIMVLEIEVPDGVSFSALADRLPILLTYVLSFANVGIFWNNHHHMLHAAERIDGRVLWANLLLLFWLSLVPYVIHWIADKGIAPLPTAAYGAVLAMAAVSYSLLQWTIIAASGKNAVLATAIGSDFKGKASIVLYLTAIPLAFLSSYLAIAVYVAIALMWFVPDRRIEARALGK